MLERLSRKSIVAIFFVIMIAYSGFGFAGRGCCSWHDGVSRCDSNSGRIVCNDGSYSPSCMCESDSGDSEKNQRNNNSSFDSGSLNTNISETYYLSHVGNCPCPYNLDSAGNLCGVRSAWCRPGGFSPVCDVTKIPYEFIKQCKGR